jgi:hypothetical protein
MGKRIVIGGLLGGVALFLWGAVSHMMTPLGSMGISVIPNEEVVLGAMRSNLPGRGLYFFPGMDLSRTPTAEEQQAWERRYQNGPAGILIYRPQGGAPMSMAQLGNELASNVVLALIAAWLFSAASGSLTTAVSRILFVALIGLVGGLDIHVSYWNWYGFPTSYTAAAMLDGFIGFLVMGVVFHFAIRKSAA